MADLLLAAWLVATARLFLPLGWLLGRLALVLPSQLADGLRAVSWQDLTHRAGAPGGALRFGAGMLSLAAYIGVITGAVHYGPKFMVWVAGTPHPVATVSSASMWPELKKGDVIVVQGVDSMDDIAVGDIIAFRHGLGVTVHRLVEIAGETLTTKGDANSVEDEPVEFSQVVGKLVTFRGDVVKLPRLGGIANIFGPLVSQDAELFDLPAAAATEPSAEDTPREALVPGKTELVSFTPHGRQFDGPSSEASLSADGRFVAFLNKTDGLVYVHSRDTKSTQLVSVNGEAAANESSSQPSISADGRFVAFASRATNLDSGDSNGLSDIFVRDRTLSTTRRISLGAGGVEADGLSEEPAISADGRFVAFSSQATNLVPGDVNGEADIFLHDLSTGNMKLVSIGESGSGSGSSASPSISSSGRFVAFVSKVALIIADVNQFSDVYVRDSVNGRTTLVSVGGKDTAANASSSSPAISADGRFVAFTSRATNLVERDFNRRQDVFVRDLQAAQTQRVSLTHIGSQSSVVSHFPSISGDGRFVTFQTADGNIVPGDANHYTDLFLFDREEGVSRLLSVNLEGQPAGDHTNRASLSYDGSVIAFPSIAPDLVEGDKNRWQDVFVRSWTPVGQAELAPSGSHR
jgi:signal peptidase I